MGNASIGAPNQVPTSKLLRCATASPSFVITSAARPPSPLEHSGPLLFERIRRIPWISSYEQAADKGWVMVKHIYVSPHSDDVALSCGGQIIANPGRKHDVVVLNIFTSADERSPQDGEETGRKLFDSINADRTTEDKSAWDSIGIDAHYLNLPESLLRQRFPFALLSNKEDSKLLKKLTDAIGEYKANFPGALFYFPAGFGNHVDHIACRAAAFELLDKGALDKILLYEDVPYSWLKFIRDQSYKALLRQIKIDKDSHAKAFRPGGEGVLSYITRKLVPFPRGRKLFPAVYASLIYGNVLRKVSPGAQELQANINFIALSDEQIAQKIDLLYHYESQIPMLFGEEPERLFAKHHTSLSREVVIEISRTPLAT